MDERAQTRPAHDNRRPSDWVTIKTFTHGEPKEGKLAVRLSVREPREDNRWQGKGGKPIIREQYKFQVGVILHDREVNGLNFFQGFRPRLSAFQGKVGIASMLEELKELMIEGETFVHEEAQRREDLRMEQRISNEQAQASRGKPLTRHTGKTQRKKDKHRHSPNQA